jgi:threonine dehydrogenase-like Zn-dependent dehydrogenase
VVTDGEQLNGYDPGFSPETAVIVQSLACVLNALERVPVAGKHVAVLGLGPIGLLFAHAVKRAGAARVTGIDPMDRRSVAEAFGLDETVRTTSGNWARQLRPKDRPEVTVEAVGHQVTTLDDALIATATGGTVLYFGIPDDDIYPLNMERLVRGNLALVAGITRNRRRALADGNAYLRDEPGLSEHLITHRFEISSIPAAFAAAALPSANRIKVVLELG